MKALRISGNLFQVTTGRRARLRVLRYRVEDAAYKVLVGLVFSSFVALVFVGLTYVGVGLIFGVWL